MHQNDVVFERSKTTRKYRKVRYILLTYVHTPKNTPQIQQRKGLIFEVYFQPSSKTRSCLFQDRAKYRAKYSYLWYLTTGLIGNEY